MTFGQYLQPTPKHLEVQEYVHPDQFDRYAEVARGMGFVYVASGPLVRSSYRAGELYVKNLLKGQKPKQQQQAPGRVTVTTTRAAAAQAAS